MLSSVEYEKSFITPGPGHTPLLYFFFVVCFVVVFLQHNTIQQTLLIKIAQAIRRWH